MTNLELIFEPPDPKIRIPRQILHEKSLFRIFLAIMHLAQNKSVFEAHKICFFLNGPKRRKNSPEGPGIYIKALSCWKVHIL